MKDTADSSARQTAAEGRAAPVLNIVHFDSEEIGCFDIVTADNLAADG